MQKIVHLSHSITIILQFRFRQQILSSSHALINITENIRKTLDDGNIGCGVFVDLQKAFDTVDHLLVVFSVLRIVALFNEL